MLPVVRSVHWPFFRTRVDGEGLQLIQCRRDRLLVRLDNARVMAHQRGDGHRLGRREREIVEHTPIGVLAGLTIRANIQSRGFLAHRQLLPGLWMKVLTEAANSS